MMPLVKILHTSDIKSCKMPRQLKFKIGKDEYTITPVKIDRRKLYGWTELMAVDDDGRLCDLLTADESGKYIIPLGGTGNGILSPDGRWVERSELKAIDADGKPAQLFRSSFDTVNELSGKVSAQEFLDYDITDFYELTDAHEELVKVVGDNIYLFEYTYNDSYEPSPAFVMAAGGTLFMLIAQKNRFEWLCFGDCGSINDDFDEDTLDSGDKDIDFSMF